MFPRIELAGERAFIVYLSDKQDATASAKIQPLMQNIRQQLGEALIDLIPSYGSVLVSYRCDVADHLTIRAGLNRALTDLEMRDASQTAQTVILPVWYSETSGPDLTALAEAKGLSVEEVVRIHTETEYRVYAIGFAPGFAYMGQVDERIAMPRLTTPRLKVPKGAVAIADQQTAVYPAPSPGGWNLIGLCPTDLFNPAVEPPMPLSVGDIVRFEAVKKEEFITLGGEV